MAAVINNSVALNAVVTSSTAMAAIFRSDLSSQTAWRLMQRPRPLKQRLRHSSTDHGAVMGKSAAKLAGLNPADYADMAAMASSSTAMEAVIGNSVGTQCGRVVPDRW